MAHIDDLLRKLARAHQSDDPITLTASDARLLHNLLSAEPQVLAADLADAAIDATFAARDCFWSLTVEEDAYWQAHRRLVRALRAVVDIGWIAVEPEETIDA